MHVRPAAFSLVALALVALVVFPSMAGAQITNPDPVGHGICTQAPGAEPVVDSSAPCFDTFLMDRASRLVLAAMQWRPVAARPVALSPVRPVAAHSRAAR